ncbi:MAG: A/G-specific adenine glycosylase, partial [Alphaproteobacteria bacterium]
MTTSIQAIKISDKKAEEFRGYMLEWYDKHKRTIPWRAMDGQKPDPYHVWLSEIMCQQTTVQAVVPYFLKFIDKWPRVHDLATAEREEVMKAWAGLGYYARARNLHKCAQIISGDYGGRFPENKADLLKLPGIGDYTSSAIAAMAFNKAETVVDGNVERIMARYLAIQTPLPKGKPDLKRAASLLFEGAHERPGDFAQSLMDLGATICTPRSPKCMICPIAEGCKAREQGIQDTLPAKEPQKPKPQKFGYVYWLHNDQGEYLLQTRPDTEMLGGMIALPTSEWLPKTQKQALSHPGFVGNDFNKSKI